RAVYDLVRLSLSRSRRDPHRLRARNPDVIGLDISARVSLVFATTDPGQILAQEIAHNMGYVNPYSQNHDTWNISHSRFDEDRPDLTFFDAPLAGDEAINVVPPGMIFQRGGTLAKSVMSYAP